MSKLKPSADPAPVLLAGATGFIGQHFQRHLLDGGFAVRALIRPGRRVPAALDAGCQVVTAELADAEALVGASADARAVVYCAGTVRGRRYQDFVAANVAGVAQIADALRRCDTPPPLLLVSSLAACRPSLSHYARSKRAGEKVLESYPDLCWSILRPPAVYGPGDVEMRPLLALVRRGVALCPGSPSQRLSLIHVADLAAAVLAWLAAAPACRHMTFAIDDGHPDGYDWTEIGQAVAHRSVRQLRIPRSLLHIAGLLNAAMAGVLGYAPMLTPGKARELQQEEWLCDNSPFSARTGWLPRIGLETGARTIFAQS